LPADTQLQNWRSDLQIHSVTATKKIILRQATQCKIACPCWERGFSADPQAIVWRFSTDARRQEWPQQPRQVARLAGDLLPIFR
jgi:hypothetical protein